MKGLLNKKNVQKATNYFNSVNGSRRIPYRTGVRIISWFCRTGFAREKYFRNRRKLFHEFLSSLQGTGDEESLFLQAIYSNFLKGWKSASLSWLSAKKLPRYVHISGHEYLDESLAKGNGVIMLNSHFGLAQAALTIFPMLGYENFHTIVRVKGLESLKFEGIRERNKPKLLIFKDNSQGELFRQMYRAREVLKEGGIVHLLGDGYHGMSSQTLDFLGKLRGFRPSYAELSMATGAAVLPFFIDCSMNGRITIDIHPPLYHGDPSDSPEKKRALMTREYAGLLAGKWSGQPWNVYWKFMEKHLYQVNAADEE